MKFLQRIKAWLTKETVDQNISYGYMCEVAFLHEIDAAMGGTKVYPSVADLLESHPSAWECGIVKVQVSLVDRVFRPDIEGAGLKW